MLHSKGYLGSILSLEGERKKKSLSEKLFPSYMYLLCSVLSIA